VVAVALEFALASAPFGRDAHVVTVRGGLDVSTAPQLRDELLRASDDGARGIVVDLLKVPFVDSAALEILVEASKRTRARGGTFRVLCNDRRIAWIAEITGLARIHTCQGSSLESRGDDAAIAAENQV
jgi:anti-sigma B factor antagonist